MLRRGRKVSSVGGGRTAAYIDGIVSRLDHLLSLGVVEGKLPKAKGKVNRLGLAWVERDASKALEIAYRLLGAGASDIDIALNDFGGAALACIGDRGGCNNGLALLIAHERSRAYGLRRKRNAGIAERRVGKTMSEGKERVIGHVQIA